MLELAKTERINLGTTYIDLYLLPSGEKRIDPKIITTILGQLEDWLENINIYGSSLVELHGYKYLKE